MREDFLEKIEIHKSVLKSEIADYFGNIATKDRYILIDCTLGLGGHSEAILNENQEVNVVGIDRDESALEIASRRLSGYGDRFRCVKSAFGSGLKGVLEGLDFKGVCGIIADIGVSSLQLDDPDRGFSFASLNLDMRMDRDSILKATEVVNTYSYSRLEEIFREFGEIRESKKMANIIVESRKKSPIKTAKELSEIIKKNFKRDRNIHPATLAFQAIRIEVNSELDELKKMLEVCKHLQNSKIRLGIISFHSLEDKIVKNSFRDWSRDCICEESVMRCECGGKNSKGKVLTKKPIVPSTKEISQNPRARSAKLRIFEFN